MPPCAGDKQRYNSRTVVFNMLPLPVWGTDLWQVPDYLVPQEDKMFIHHAWDSIVDTCLCNIQPYIRSGLFGDNMKHMCNFYKSGILRQSRLFNSLRPGDAYMRRQHSNLLVRPVRCQAIIWSNAGILSIGPLGRNFSESLNEIQTSSLRKMHLKISSAKWHYFVSVSMW